MFHHLETLLLSFATTVPLPLFAIVASFIEEVVAPIPSGPVMLLAGSIANVQHYTLSGVLVLALIAATGKLGGALVVYIVSDKAEDLVSGNLGKFFGVTHEQIEHFGKRFGNGWKDYVLLTFLRALPIVPSVVVSVGAGVLKLPIRLFIVATVIGSVIRDSVFLYLGYTGFAAAETLLNLQSGAELAVLIAIGVGVLGVLIYLYRHHAKSGVSRQGR